MTEHDPASAFITSAVHIAIQQKIHTSCIIHFQQTEIMLFPVSSAILSICESIDQTQTVLAIIITPQLSLLYKSNHIFFCILHIDRFSALDTEGQFSIFHQLTARFQDLVCPALIGQQVDSCRSIAQTVCFSYLILLTGLCVGHLIFHGQSGNIALQLGETKAGLSSLNHLHVPPGHRAGTGVNVNISQILSIHTSILLQIIQYAIRITGQRHLMKPLRKIHAVLHMIRSQISQYGIEPYQILIFGLYLQYQKIFFSLRQKIFECQRNMQILSIVFRLQIVSTFDQTTHVQTSYFVGHRFDLCIVFFQCQSHFMIL